MGTSQKYPISSGIGVGMEYHGYCDDIRDISDTKFHNGSCFDTDFDRSLDRHVEELVRTHNISDSFSDNIEPYNGVSAPTMDFDFCNKMDHQIPTNEYNNRNVFDRPYHNYSTRGNVKPRVRTFYFDKRKKRKIEQDYDETRLKKAKVPTQQDTEYINDLSKVEVIKLRYWYLRFLSKNTPALVQVRGYRSIDGGYELYGTSGINERINSTVLKSTSGTYYKLEGCMHSDTSKKALKNKEILKYFDKGFPEDWRDKLDKMIIFMNDE
eukprot:TRINITY_DN5030_c0_g1_i3.p1 TRINITY_DN5030_c0_g1~~TRINITY_DN5030_c0_g1_i3.p1  ORF type:complete len:267 (-),score=60.25 TRINITY_DN5030_c0_g1_i3:36-836(-)